MAAAKAPEPTDRELQILQILWQHGEATVRQVYEQMREHGIVQNTVQAFLRTMTDKGLTKFRRSGRTFIYRPVAEPTQTKRGLLNSVLDRAFDGALDQLVANAIALRAPSADELAKLRTLVEQLETAERRDEAAADRGQPVAPPRAEP